MPELTSTMSLGGIWMLVKRGWVWGVTCCVVLMVAVPVAGFLWNRNTQIEEAQKAQEGIPQIEQQVSPPPVISNSETSDSAATGTAGPMNSPAPSTPAAQMSDNTDCYELSILNETTEGRKASKESRERVMSLMDAKLQDGIGATASLSGSDDQNLTISSGVRWPEDKELITHLANSFKRHMIDSRADTDFCNASFGRVRFIAVDNVGQSIHVIWALRITKKAYRDITLEDQIQRNVEGQ
jgi:hypothetical protein